MRQGRPEAQKQSIPAVSPGDTVVMDNLSSHKRSKVAALIEGPAASLLHLLPMRALDFARRPFRQRARKPTATSARAALNDRQKSAEMTHWAAPGPAGGATPGGARQRRPPCPPTLHSPDSLTRVQGRQRHGQANRGVQEKRPRSRAPRSKSSFGRWAIMTWSRSSRPRTTRRCRP
jgi:hypothetical protein